jgi:hypothetical protein
MAVSPGDPLACRVRYSSFGRQKSPAARLPEADQIRPDAVAGLLLLPEWCSGFRVVADFRFIDAFRREASSVVATNGRRPTVNLKVDALIPEVVAMESRQWSVPTEGDIPLVPEYPVPWAGRFDGTEAWTSSHRIVIAGTSVHEATMTNRSVLIDRSMGDPKVFFGSPKAFPVLDELNLGIVSARPPEIRVFFTRNFSFSVVICADFLHPLFFAALAETRADLILVPSDSGMLDHFERAATTLSAYSCATTVIANMPTRTGKSSTLHGWQAVARNGGFGLARGDDPSGVTWVSGSGAHTVTERI